METDFLTEISSRSESQVTKVTTVDKEGLPIVVLVPGGIPVEEGIPISLPLNLIFGSLPVDFRKRLYNALWDRGLVEPSDYLKPEASSLYKAAILSIIRTDFYDLVRLAQETLNDGS